MPPVSCCGRGCTHNVKIYHLLTTTVGFSCEVASKLQRLLGENRIQVCCSLCLTRNLNALRVFT
jgi:hypothetical protein